MKDIISISLLTPEAGLAFNPDDDAIVNEALERFEREEGETKNKINILENMVIKKPDDFDWSFLDEKEETKCTVNLPTFDGMTAPPLAPLSSTATPAPVVPSLTLKKKKKGSGESYGVTKRKRSNPMGDGLTNFFVKKNNKKSDFEEFEEKEQGILRESVKIMLAVKKSKEDLEREIQESEQEVKDADLRIRKKEEEVREKQEELLREQEHRAIADMELELRKKITKKY
jgi:hypothetical protein